MSGRESPMQFRDRFPFRRGWRMVIGWYVVGPVVRLLPERWREAVRLWGLRGF